MQANEFEDLRKQLQELDAETVAPTWDKAMAWKKLDVLITPGKRNVIPLWQIASAAAAVLIIGFMLGRFTKPAEHLNGEYSAHQQETKQVPINDHTPADPIPEIVQKKPEKTAVAFQKQSTVIRSAIKYSLIDTDAATIDKNVMVPRSTKEPEIIIATRRQPEIILTADELLRQAPEDHKPAYNYTGIFKLKPIAREEQNLAARPSSRNKQEEQTPLIY